ncbi:MAG: cysteine hydrolase [Proteobacteria bacterium]|nr:cysteine hydrolase [Pseudomonadota bacterium]
MAPTALLIIDVQQALCTGPWAAHAIDHVIERINALSARARAADLPVVFVQHEDDGPLTHGSAGWQLAAPLETQPSDVRVRKTTPDSFCRTELHELLQQRGIQRLAVCGLQSDFCVDTTVRRALALGYDVELASDAHSTIANGVLSAEQIIDHHNATLANLGFGPQIAVTAAEAVRLGG